MKETYGVPVEEIQEAIKHGVRKINIDTDIRLAMTGAVRKFLAENPEKFDARDGSKPAREAAKQICKQRYIEFGCEGQAARSRALSLQVVANRMRKGELAAGRCTELGRRPPHLQHHLAAAAGARQGARQLSGRHDRILMVASDRLSGVRRDHGRARSPGKGEILTQHGLFWFARLGPLCPTT
jgi:hypothetical protein